jgi:diguanylate cyclase (GGDEF)-like protein
MEFSETASLTNEPATGRHKFVMGIIAVAVSLAAAASWYFGGLRLRPVAAFLPACGTAVFLTELMTALLLFSQLRLTRVLAEAFLASAYLFAGLIVIVQLLMFPGLYAPPSAVWLWFFWHGGFPAFVIAYALARLACGHARSGRMVANMLAVTFALGTVGLVIALSYLVTVAPAWLLPLSAQQLSLSAWGLGVQGLNLAALLLVIAVTRCRTVRDLGLVIAMLASLLDVVLTLHTGGRFTLAWYVARGIGVLSAGSVLAVLLAQVGWLHAQLVQLNARLDTVACRDGLTGLANRGWFDEQLAVAWRYAARQRAPLALLLIDIDFFKHFNELYGHMAGEDCLRQVAFAIKNEVHRPIDLAARYGGAAFALILPETDIDGAFHIASRVRDAVRDLAIAHEESKLSAVVTVSLGLAALVPPPSDVPSGSGGAAMTRAAAAALEAAKKQGHDRIAAAPVQVEALG